MLLRPSFGQLSGWNRTPALLDKGTRCRTGRVLALDSLRNDVRVRLDFTANLNRSCRLSLAEREDSCPEEISCASWVRRPRVREPAPPLPGHAPGEHGGHARQGAVRMSNTIIPPPSEASLTCNLTVPKRYGESKSGTWRAVKEILIATVRPGKLEEKMITDEELCKHIESSTWEQQMNESKTIPVPTKRSGKRTMWMPYSETKRLVKHVHMVAEAANSGDQSQLDGAMSGLYAAALNFAAADKMSR